MLQGAKCLSKFALLIVPTCRGHWSGEGWGGGNFLRKV